MKIATLLFSITLSLVASTSRAEHINGLKTWVADDLATVGMLHYDGLANGRVGWTTNGKVHECVQTSVEPANYRTTVYCPAIDYTFYVSRTRIEIVSRGTSTFYGGHWDDRRFKFYQSGAMVGRFMLLDNFRWTEEQYVNDHRTASYAFVETSRDNDWIYLHDASRDIWVALGSTKIFVRGGAGAWVEYYTGSW